MSIKDEFEPRGLLVEYRHLGTVSIDELKQAIFTDLECLRDIYGVEYVTAPTMKIFATNEYGEGRPIKRPDGSKLMRIDTHHYRPACKDYNL